MDGAAGYDPGMDEPAWTPPPVIASKVPDLSGVPLGSDEGEGSPFSSSI